MLSDKIKYYSKHREEFARVRMVMEHLDYLYTQPATKENLNDFNKSFNSLSLKLEEYACLGWHRNLDMVMYCGVDEIDVVRYIRPFREVEVDNYYF